MPKWGLAMKEGSITTWLKNEGDSLKKGEVFVEIETEKVVNEYESPENGILLKKVLMEGEKISVGGLIGILGDKNAPIDEVNTFIETFQSNFIPIENDDEIESLEKTISINNTAINYLHLGDEKNENVLFVHGFGGDLNNWMFNQEELSSEYNTYALDLPGHGKSSKIIEDGSIDYLTDIIKNFCSQNHLEKIHLVGHSLGGGICINLAKYNQNLVKSLTLLSPIGLGDEIDEYVKEFIDADSRKELKPQLEKLYYNTDLITRDLLNEVLKYKRLDGVSESLKRIMNDCLYENNKQKTYLRDQLVNLNMKLTIIWGNNDKIIPVTHTKNLPKNIKCKIINESGHMPHIEKSKEINEVLLEINK